MEIALNMCNKRPSSSFHLIIVGEEGVEFFHCESDALHARKKGREKM